MHSEKLKKSEGILKFEAKSIFFVLNNVKKHSFYQFLKGKCSNFLRVF